MKKFGKIKKTVGFSNIEEILKNSKILDKKFEKDTYKGIKDLERDVKENEDVKKAFENINNPEEAIKIAQDLGYKINREEIENNEDLAESMLESVAGGKVTVKSYSFSSDTIAAGENSKVETNVIWRAGRK